MFYLVLVHVNNFGIYLIENKLDFVSFDDKNLERRSKFVGERDFPADFQCPSHSRDPEICDVISAKRYFEDTFWEKCKNQRQPVVQTGKELNIGIGTGVQWWGLSIFLTASFQIT